MQPRPTPPPPIRPIEDIEQAFRDMGIAKGSWGTPAPSDDPESEAEPQIFIRLSSTTTPQGKLDADLA